MSVEIIAASDTHGSNHVLEQLEQAYPRADLFIHCGDLEDDAARYPRWIFVRGNNDWDFNMPSFRIIRAGGVRIYICHSHTCSYYRREEQLAKTARENDCQMVIFGHTHIPLGKKVDGILLVNPGSMTYPRDGNSPCYAKIVIDDPEHIHVDLIHQEDWPFEQPEKKKMFSWWRR